MSRGQGPCQREHKAASSDATTSTKCENDRLMRLDKEGSPERDVTCSTASESSFSSIGSTTDFRKVRFGDTSDNSLFVIENCFHLTADERQVRWYGRDEMRQGKVASKQTASQVRCNSKLRTLIQSSLDLCIFIAHASSCESGNTSTATTTQDIKSVAAILASEMREWVAATTSQGDVCRGVENVLLRQDRGAFAQDARSAVVHGTTNGHDQLVAEKYKDFSKPATIFAAAIAQADAAEVGN